MNNNLLLTTDMTDQSYVDAIMQVTREQIIELVNAATLNTIYILTKGKRNARKILPTNR